jgi:hypothetical protein
MLVLERILAIPDESVDYLQMGISGGERAALEKRGFIRADGTKAKDYMIRTIQKTAKNKAKTEKAIIKGDVKFSWNENIPWGENRKALKNHLEKLGVSTGDEGVAPDSYWKDRVKKLERAAELTKKDSKSITQSEFDEMIDTLPVKHPIATAMRDWQRDTLKDSARVKALKSKYGENAGLTEIYKNEVYSKPQNTIAPDTAKKIKAAIAGVKGGKVVKGDKKLNETPDKKGLEQRLSKINQELQTPYLATAKFKPLVVSNPDRFESLSKEAKEINKSLGNKKREFYESTQDQASTLLRMPAARHKKYVEDALKSGKTVPTEVLKDYPDLAKQYSKPSNKIAVTYNKQGDLSAGSAAKKIKGAMIASTSATPKSRKVVKGESPDTRNAGYINYGGGKAQNGKIRLVDYRNKDVNAYVAKLDENGDRKFVNDHGKADTNAFKGKENVKEWNIKKLEDGVYEANSRQGVGTRGVEKSYFSVKKGKIDNYFDNYQQAKEVLTPKEKRINKTSLSGSSDKQISYAESVRDKAIAKLQSKGLSPSDIQKAVSDPQTQTARWWLDNKDNAVDKIYNTMMKQKISRL